MVETTPISKVYRWLTSGLILGISGCASVPRSQMEESRQQVVSLRAELAQTKDLAAKLRTQNREIAARAVEDARRIATLEDSNQALEDSVLAYQDEREKYAESLRAIQSGVLAAGAANRPSAMVGPLDSFLARFPDCQYDARSRTLTIREDRLFGADDALTTNGISMVDELGAAMARDPQLARGADVLMNRDEGTVQRVSNPPAGGSAASRAHVLRSRLIKVARWPDSLIETRLDEDPTTPPPAHRAIRITFRADPGA